MLVRHKKFALFLLMFTSYTMLSGMVCGRALNFTIQVLNPFQQTVEMPKILAEAGIKESNGKIPDGVDKTITYRTKTVDLDLDNHEKTRAIFTEYGSKIHSIYVNRIHLDVDTNTFEYDLSRIQVEVAPFGSKTFELIGSFNELPAEVSKTSSMFLWEPKGQERIHEIMATHKIQIRFVVSFRVKGGDPYPKGNKGILKLSMPTELVFVFSP